MNGPGKDWRIPDREALEWVNSTPMVKVWIDKLRSRRTREIYGKNFYRFHLLTGYSPEQLLELAKEGKRTGEPVAERMLEFSISKAKSMEVNKWMIRDMGIAVKSFYRENFYGLSPKAGRMEIPRSKEYRCPTQEQVKAYTKGMNLRDTAIVEFLASAPFREETLLGLRLSHLLEDLMNPREDGTIHVSAMGKEMKGGGVGRFRNLEQHAFLHREAADTLRLYLNDKLSMDKIHKLKDRSPATVKNQLDKHNEAIKRVGFCSVCKRAGGVYFKDTATRSF